MTQEWFLGIQAEKEIDKVNWSKVSQYQTLPEDFIEKHSDNVDWYLISSYQLLSESFIEKYSDKVYWEYIFQYQKLSENFIERFADKVNWYCISRFQKLSESFIEKYSDKVNWINIFQWQQLSEFFIEKYFYKVDLHFISKYQKLSSGCMRKQHISKPKNNWLYITKEDKKQAIKDCGQYEIDGDYVIVYKTTRKDGIYCHNFQHVYEVGKVYKSHCDCNIDEENFFGGDLCRVII